MRLKLNKYISITMALMYMGIAGGAISNDSLPGRVLNETLGMCRIAEAGNITPGMGTKKKKTETFFGNLQREPVKPNNKKGEYSFEIDMSYHDSSNKKTLKERPAETSIAYKQNQQPAKPAAEESKTAGKPAAQPVKPAAQPAKPAAQPAKPAAQPAKPPAQPAKPAAQPAKPAAQPVKPATQPAKPAVTKPAEGSAWNKATYKPAEVPTVAKPKEVNPKPAAKDQPNKANSTGLGNIPMLTGKYSGIKDHIDEITVGLDGGLRTATVSTVTDYDIYADTTGQPLGAFKSGSMVTFGVSAGITINGTRVAGSAIALVPRINGKSGNGRGHGLRFQGTEYRGEIVIELNSSGNLRIFNRVQIDDYIKGVVPSEMSPSWNIEALKAQAVAARTFALYNKKQGNHDDGGYDVCESSHCQVYEGYDGEDLASNAAVDATAGQVLMFGGQVIYAPFHASSGGLTENINDLWGSKAPYLQSVYDDDSESPYHNWSEDWTAAELQADLDAASKGVGKLISIGFQTNNGKPDGRMLSATFKGTAGTVTVDGGDMRSIFGLKSSYFTFKSATVPKPPKATKDTKVTKDTKATKDTWNFINIANPSQHITLSGHGYGHGLGLSQYGAKAMGDKGQNYKTILSHYYIGAELKQLY